MIAFHIPILNIKLILRKIVIVIIVLVFTFILALYHFSPISPESWQPEKAPSLVQALAPNSVLASAQTIILENGVGHEDIVADDYGNLFVGAHDGSYTDGSILKIRPDGSVITFARTGGLPAGLHLDQDGRLLVCDSHKGLLRFTQGGTMETLATSVGGVAFGILNDLDVTTEGTIYFTDSTSQFHYTLQNVRNELLQAQGNGLLLKYTTDKGVSVIAKGLYWPNGLLLSDDESFLLIAESFRYRILKFWLKGPKAGQIEIWANNLPGFPNGLTTDGRGHVFVGFIAVRSHFLDSIHPFPFIKRLIASIPYWMQPQAKRYGLLTAYNWNGQLLASWHDPPGNRVREISSAEIFNHSVFFGSDNQPYVALLPLAVLSQSFK